MASHGVKEGVRKLQAKKGVRTASAMVRWMGKEKAAEMGEAMDAESTASAKPKDMMMDDREMMDSALHVREERVRRMMSRMGG